MIPSRRTQPYRKGIQQPGATLDAMTRGRPGFLPNPADQQRRQQKLIQLLLRQLRV